VSEFEWMDEEVLGNTMTDFFYKRPVEYAKKNNSFISKTLSTS
jgi:ribonucleoside-diphosphate reductase beta chain